MGLCGIIFLSFLCGFVSTYTVSRNDELISLKNLEAELEMCFGHKVKTYCQSKMAQKDAAAIVEPQISGVTASAIVEPQIVAATASETKSLSYIEDELYEYLFKNYQKNSIAKLGSGKTVQVQVGFTLIQLNNLDEKSQVLTTSGWMEVIWQDVRLQWQNLSKFEKLESVVVSAESIWLPDMALQNSATDIYHSSLVEHKFRVNIYSDGSILWVPGGKYYTNCELDISYFPFDDQTCKLHFTNWAYNGVEMNLTVKEPHISLSDYQVNGEWDVVTTTAHREDKFYACCGDTPYPSIYFTIYMRRKYLFYVTNIIAPCVMLSMLITCVFYLPPEAGEKVSLGITVLLSCIVFLLLIAESIPKRSDSVPIISIYLAAFLAITTTSIISTVVVLHVHHMGTRKVPTFVKKVVFDMLARMMCMTTLADKYGVSSCRARRADTMDTSMTSIMLNSSRNPSILTRHGQPNKLSPTQTHQRKSTHNGKVGVNNGVGGMKKSFSTTEDRIAQHLMLNRNFVLEEILMHIKVFTQERNNNEQVESTRHEWMAVAKVLDRFFMIIFMSSIACSSFFVLIMLPMAKTELGPK